MVMDNNLPEPNVLLADRSKNSDNVRKILKSSNDLPLIPMQKSRKLRLPFDRKLYRQWNCVERCFNRLKDARRAVTRYEKTVESFLAFTDMTSIRLWLRQSSA
jgi:transposase